MSCFVNHRRRGGSLNGDMSSLHLSDHSGLYAGNFGGDHADHDHVDAQDLGAAVAKEVTEKKKQGERAENKAATALKKNHSEAERRRRERINAHLATLRGMVPCTDKMDKAALLAEVITHVKKLKTDAARVSSRCPVPADADEVTVELVRQDDATVASSSSFHGSGGGGFLVKATLSCGDGADLFTDVMIALRPLRGLKVVGSDVTTLGGRVRFTFFLMHSSACGGGDDSSAAVESRLVESVRQALQSVIDKANSTLEFAPRTSLLNKRRRVSTFESSSSSS